MEFVKVACTVSYMGLRGNLKTQISQVSSLYVRRILRFMHVPNHLRRILY